MSKSIKIRGVNIVYDDFGKGFPIVMIHGQPFNRSMWKYQIPSLEKSFRLIIPDLRGYGESEVPKGMVLLDELALDIEELLAQLRVEKVIFMGLSMGGQIALEFFKLFPKKVAGLVLADTDSRAEDEVGYQRRIMLSEKIIKDRMVNFTKERIHHFISTHSMNNLPDVVEHLKQMMESTNPIGSSLVQRGRAERKDLTPYLEKINAPTLFVVGEDDQFTPISTSEFMHQKVNNSNLAIIQKAGHIPNMEQAEQFNKTLLEFLEKNFR